VYRDADGYPYTLRYSGYFDEWFQAKQLGDVQMSEGSEATFADAPWTANRQHMFYISADHHLHDRWDNDGPGSQDVDRTYDHAGLQAGYSPSAYFSDGDHVMHILYCAGGTIYQFDHISDDRWYHWQLTDRLASHNSPLGFSSHDAFDSNGYTSYVVYRAENGHLHVMSLTLRPAP
jgi:hypothetical protein